MLANFSNLITFSRGSNATVTDASGRLTYAANNLLPSSQDFEATTWVKSNVAVTANALTAPDGSITADTVTENSANGDHSVARLAALTQTSVLSIYAKAGTRNVLALGESSNGTYAKFDLSSGVVLSTGTGQISGGAITPAGDGWYRCSCIYTHGGVNRSLGISMCDASGNVSYAGNGTGSLYLWGAQLEAVTYQTTPSPYVSTSVANLLGFSEAFDNAAWSKIGAAIVPSAAQNPINNLWNAQKLMEDTAFSGHQALQTVVTTANPWTFSVFVKAGGRNWAALGITDSGSTVRITYFDLVNGVVGTVATGVTASIVAVGNGWYRCAVRIASAAAGSNNLRVYATPADGTTSYTGDGNSGIYIYGAQLSNSGSLDPYVPTPGAAPSSTAYYGPRFDYDPVTLAAKGILIEEQRTNLLTYSEQFNIPAAWTVSGVAISDSTIVSPEGTLDADKMTENTTSISQFAVRQTYGSFVAGAYTFTFYAKAAERTWTYFEVGNTYANVNLSTGAVGATGQFSTGWTFGSASATAVGNGWYRCSITSTCTTPGSYFGGKIHVANADNVIAYAGTVGSGIYIYGAQLEAGAFATSYIPTVASQVTRTADVASITGSLFSQWTGGATGTFVASWDSYVLTTPPANRQVVGFGGTTGLAYVNTGNTFNSHDGANYATAGGTITTAGPHKGAWSFGASGMSVCVNGGTVGTGTYNNSFGAATSLGIASNGTSLFVNGHIQNITYYPTRLTNDQLQAITK